jgi:ABC-type transport system involved in multi-copper enzyme maturation permease subunit
MYYIWKEWKENIRGKGLWLFSSLIIIVSISMLFQSSVLSYDQGFYVLIMNLFDTLVYFIPILSLFLGAFSVFQEKEQKTLIMLLTKQESFLSFLLKKSIGVQTVLIGPVIIWFFLYLLPVKFYFQPDLKGYFLFTFALSVLILIFTQIGIFIGSVSRSRMQIVGSTIFIWFYFFFLHDFALLSFLPNVTYENVKLFSLFYFLNPIPAVRMFLESGLGVYSFGHMSKLLQSFMWTKPTIFLISNLLIWMTGSFLFSVFFHRKEGVE